MYKPLPRTVFTITVRGTKKEKIMIAILTDKPNVGKEIARILGAQTRENGYMTGNGYMVTWTFGNMLSLAMPKDYGIERPEREAFPLNPAPFKLMVKHVKTDTGWVPDINAVLQLKVIEKVFAACDTIIAATDASREGEWYSDTYTNIWTVTSRTAAYGFPHSRMKPYWRAWRISKRAACLTRCSSLQTAVTRRTGCWG